MQGRIDYIDRAKGIAILAIVLGHFSIPFVCILTTDIFYRIVHTFHVPLFFIVAGMFIKPAKAKVSRLLFPCAVVSLVVLALRIVYGFVIGNPSPIHDLLSVAYGLPWWWDKTFVGPVDPAGPIWFLYALAWSSLAFVWLCRRRYGFAVAIVFAAGTWVYSWMRLPCLPVDILQASYGLCYLYVGHHLRFMTSYIERPNLVFALVGLVSFVVEMYLGLSVNVAMLSLNPVPYVLAVPISYSVLYFTYIIGERHCISRFLSFIGRHTMLILCFHSIALFDFHWSGLFRMGQSFGMPAVGLRIMFAVAQYLWPLAGLFAVLSFKRLRRS